VAALNGVALGGGAELALACDFRIAAAHARIGYIQATLNICSGFGGGADLMRLLGHRRGLLHGLKAEVLGAADAIAFGLLDEVALPGESLEDCVDRFLRPMLGRTPQVIRAYKAMALAERQLLSGDKRRDIEREWFCRTWAHDDHWSAVDQWAQQKQVPVK
jgi:enoyl-CoA hydratase